MPPRGDIHWRSQVMSLNSRLKSWLGSRLMAYSLTSLDTSHDWCPSLGVSHGAGQLDGDLHHDSPLNITTKLEFGFTNTRNFCHRNKIYVLTSPLKQIYWQPALCAWIYCAVNKVCHSSCHHHEFTSWRTHEERCCYRGSEMTSQLLPLTLSETMSCRLSNDTIWDLRHDLGHDLTESRWCFFVNVTWLGPGPSLKWDSVRVQAKSWVKSQVKSVSEYCPRAQLAFRNHSPHMAPGCCSCVTALSWQQSGQGLCSECKSSKRVRFESDYYRQWG